MYVTVVATPRDAWDRKEVSRIEENSPSLSEAMMLVANGMIDHLSIANWNITVSIEDPPSA